MWYDKVIPYAVNFVNQRRHLHSITSQVKLSLYDLKQKFIGPNINHGQNLVFSLGDLEWAQTRNWELMNDILSRMPEYKNFHSMIHQLILNFRSSGVGLSNLKFIADCLSEDLLSERKIQRILVESLLQFVFLILFSLAFSSIFNNFIKIPLGPSNLPLVIISIQSISVLLAFFLLQKMRKIYFNDIDFWLNTLLQLEAWSMSGGNFSEVVAPKVNDLVQLERSTDLNPVAKRLFASIRRWHSEGGDLSPDIRRLLLFLYQLRDQRFARFSRATKTMTFLLMIVLFLGGHLLQIANLCFTLLR